MKLFEQHFPLGIQVVVLTNEKGTVVRAFTPRSAPTWINSEKEGIKVSKKQIDKRTMREELLNLVKEQPGGTKTFYTQLPLSNGGVRGTHQRKMEVLLDIISSGQIVLKHLEKAVGRKNHSLFIA